MMIHSVYFWMTDELRGRDNAEFEAALKELMKIDKIAAGQFGPPAH